ncbi:MAG: DUF488 domain-containing protein [Eubacterium coprostanoligenes]|uniref:DUF488 domain-containing protein n=1 Tax=Eubacterium coprostanoligenes TaxID=290054 RepID=UPI002A8355F1|nr:DUF488 domain-containing protein [Eubacterium coprostanoligenes]MCI6361199.1 DUF488 domain-containing protein [Eubacterium coprostanoligenes]MDY4698679.1 DUF488 domain-containing protein [Eubacterium coprostanoligenes]
MIIISCIYTIGYSAFSINEFIETIKNFGISCVIDVRSSPFSNYYADYNKDTLERTLKEHNILYRNYANEFGARQTDPMFYTGDIVDFDKFIKSAQFLEGVSKVNKGIERGYSFVLMCAEKDPIKCHRSIMLGKGFSENGFDVKHIVSKTEIESQRELEERLLEMYHHDRFQLTFFREEQSDSKLLADAYKKQNLAIGYNKNTNIEQGDEE